MARELKDIITKDIETRFAGMDGCVVFDYQGLSAEDTFQLRRNLRQDGVRMNVVQNRLSKDAAVGLGGGTEHIVDGEGIAGGTGFRHEWLLRRLITGSWNEAVLYLSLIHI